MLLLGTSLFAAPAARPKQPAGLSDAAIEQNIKARFARSKINSEKFSVRVQGGVATIEGNTDVIQRKGTASRLAKLGGARRVDNRIRISDEARRKAAERLTKNRAPHPVRPTTPKPAAPSAARPKTSTAAAAPVSRPATPRPAATTPPAIPRAAVKH
jgi:hypothetical protein